MPVTQVQNSKANVKKFSTNDNPYAPAQPVANQYLGVSTAGQTSIANLGFSVDTTAPQNFMLFVDGKSLTLGSDFTFAAIAADFTSSAINFLQTLPVGLNIQATKLGLKKESEFLTDNRLTQLYEAQNQGFQGFINTQNVLLATAAAGTPTAGTFYSSIQNRANLVDLTQDLKPRMGIDRIAIEQIFQLQTEFGPNGELAWGVANDTIGQIRFVGNWANQLGGAYGGSIFPTLATDYCEVTFYGTGLNLLMQFGSGALTLAISVDGGAETTVANSTYSQVISTRNYTSNQILNAVNGLSLGVHTVKFRNSAGNASVMNIDGIELINSSSTVITSPGVSYLQGKKQTLAAQSAIAYNAAVTGTTGGRVLQYQKADGTVAQAFQAAATSPSYLTASSHANEEIVRTYHYREFGIGRTDDFSAATTFASNAYTLDDGTTTLLAGTAVASSFGESGVAPSGAGGFIQFTFVGTGLDILMGNEGTTINTFPVTVDGVSAGNLTAIGTANTLRTIKIASGLPYGTHTVKIVRSNSTTANGVGFSRFVVYQPKTPALPAGAVALGTYNVAANYALNATIGNPSIVSQGTLRKGSTREFLYTGSWSVTGTDIGFADGWNITTTTAGSTASYTFFGTGFDLRLYVSNTAYNYTVSVDGSSNLSTYTTSYNYTGSGLTFTPSTGTVSGTAAGSATYSGSVLSVSGLPLGLHTFKITQNTTSNIYLDILDIITPIHSPKLNTGLMLQNDFAIGSQGIQDVRVFTPNKDTAIGVKNVVFVDAIVSGLTSTVNGAPMADMNAVFKSNTGRFAVTYSAVITNQTAGSTQYVSVGVDGLQLSYAKGFYNSVANALGCVGDRYEYTCAPGSTHNVQLYWNLNQGTMLRNNANMIIEDL